MEGAAGQLIVERFGDAEVDNFGDRLAVVLGDKDVGRLDVAVEDAFVMGMLDGVADGQEQGEAVAEGEAAIGAVGGDGGTVDPLHDQEGPAALGAAGFEHGGDVGVVHHGQGLALDFKAGDPLAGVHAGLDEFESDVAAYGLLLLGVVDDAHAAAADFADELIGTDEGAGGEGCRRIGSEGRGSEFHGGAIEEVAAGASVVGEEGFDFAAEFQVAGAGLVEEGGAEGRRGGGGPVVEVLDAFEAGRLDHSASCP